MKKVIDEIKKIKRVKSVSIDEINDNTLIVRVEPGRIAIKCTNSEQYEFTCTKKEIQIDRKFHNPFSAWYEIAYIVPTESLTMSKDAFDSDSRYGSISFSQYLTDYNLTDEWEKYKLSEAERRGFVKGVKHTGQSGRQTFTVGKLRMSTIGNIMGTQNNGEGCVYSEAEGSWAEIVKEELVLVPGEIYKCIHEGKKYTIRLDVREDGTIYYLTMLCYDGDFFTYNHFDISGTEINSASKNEKRKHIKKESKNNFFWELESKNK